MASDDLSPVIYDGAKPRSTLNSAAPLFFPNRFHHFSQPPIHFIHLPPPPPPIFVYCPRWSFNPNPNPNRFLSFQEITHLHSQNPSQELALPHPRRRTRRRYQVRFGREKFLGRRCNKVMWRRRIKDEVVSNGDDHSTTVMLRNIPNRYTREMMIEFLDKHCEKANSEEDGEFPISAYDFFYLPMDFKSGLNKGYAFVNFTNAEAVRKFKVACDNKPWTHYSSRKILEIANARIQGKEELVKHFQLMTYPVETYSAVCFSPARSGLEDEVETIMVGRCDEPTTSV